MSSTRSCLGLALALVLAAPAGAQTTPAENAAAFAESAVIANRSYHWDSTSGGVPQVATSPRVTLPGTTLTTVSWNPLDTDFYQIKTIDSVPTQCTLVATFAGPFSTWTSPAGTVTQLTYSVSGTTNFIMPFVTWGDSLHDYLRTTYFPSASIPSPAEAQLRIQQSLGLPFTTSTSHGLAFFWVPIANLARPAYSADVSAQFPMSLPTYPDGSYEAVTAGAPSGFSYLDFADSTKTYSTLPEYVEWNQSQTTYPWSAMGYTFNWNALQNGVTPAFGDDPLAPSSFFGVSEFIVSAGSKIVNERFVPNGELGIWVVPEPASWVIVLVGLCGAGWAVHRRGRPSGPDGTSPRDGPRGGA